MFSDKTENKRNVSKLLSTGRQKPMASFIILYIILACQDKNKCLLLSHLCSSSVVIWLWFSTVVTGWLLSTCTEGCNRYESILWSGVWHKISGQLTNPFLTTSLLIQNWFRLKYFYIWFWVYLAVRILQLWIIVQIYFIPSNDLSFLLGGTSDQLFTERYYLWQISYIFLCLHWSHLLFSNMEHECDFDSYGDEVQYSDDDDEFGTDTSVSETKLKTQILTVPSTYKL